MLMVHFGVECRSSCLHGVKLYSINMFRQRFCHETAERTVLGSRMILCLLADALLEDARCFNEYFDSSFEDRIGTAIDGKCNDERLTQLLRFWCELDEADDFRNTNLSLERRTKLIAEIVFHESAGFSEEERQAAATVLNGSYSKNSIGSMRMAADIRWFRYRPIFEQNRGVSLVHLGAGRQVYLVRERGGLLELPTYLDCMRDNDRLERLRTSLGV